MAVPVAARAVVSAPLLAISRLARSFGGIQALNGASFTRGGPGICGVIGPNGAGKTTLFDAISGRIAVDAGSVRFAGEELLDRPAHDRVAVGVVRTFQECRVFAEKTCLDNLLFSLQAKSLGAVLLRMFGGDKRRRRAQSEECRHLLAQVGLADYADQSAGILSYGQRRLLEIVAGLIAKPRLLLLDEPASGVNPALLERLIDFLAEAQRQSDTLFLIVEHNMEFIMALADEIVVMHQGAVLEQGTPAQIQTSARVIDAYLG